MPQGWRRSSWNPEMRTFLPPNHHTVLWLAKEVMSLCLFCLLVGHDWKPWTAAILHQPPIPMRLCNVPSLSPPLLVSISNSRTASTVPFRTHHQSSVRSSIFSGLSPSVPFSFFVEQNPGSPQRCHSLQSSQKKMVPLLPPSLYCPTESWGRYLSFSSFLLLDYPPSLFSKTFWLWGSCGKIIPPVSPHFYCHGWIPRSFYPTFFCGSLSFFCDD